MSLPPGLRLRSKHVEPRGEPIQFRFEGETVPALAGETVAAALTAAGHVGLRQVASGERRGVFCGMGACQECIVEIDGRGSQRACMTSAVAGMDVRRHDPALAQLAPLVARPTQSPPVERCAVAIVGAGPAALAAATVLADAGVEPILIDERGQPGGQFFKPVAPSHSMAPGAEDAQFAQGRILVGQVRDSGADLRSGQTVWHAAITHDGGVALGVHAPAGAYVIEARAVLVAGGAYEMPHHIPGWTLPGVMTAGAAQTLARAYRVSPGERVLIAGNGPLNWQVAVEIARGGGRVVAVLESARPSRASNIPGVLGMLRADPALALAGARMRLNLALAGIPLHEGVVVTALEGKGRVSHAIAQPAGGQGTPLHFDVDAVCLGYGFTPSLELIRMLGGAITVHPKTGYPVPVLSSDGRICDRPLWVAGDAAGIGGSQVAQAQGALAAASILKALGHSVPAQTQATAQHGLERARAFQSHLWSVFGTSSDVPVPTPDTVICRCEDITAGRIETLRRAGVRDLGSLKRQSRLGMGRCQGRYCAGAALRLLRGGDLTQATEADLFAPQAPSKPMPALALADEKGEWGGHREVETGIAPPAAFDPAPLPPNCDLLVIGAGIIGASTAMFAARNGMDVVVIDRSAPNSQASGGNAGSLHVQLLSWDFGSKAMAGGSPALQTLSLQRDSVALWKALEDELCGDFEIVTTGGLMVAEDEAQTAFLRNKAASERRAGIEVDVIGRGELVSLAPAISDRMVVAAYCAAEGKINPLKATPAIVAEAERHGARFAAGHEVIAIDREATGFRVTTRETTIGCRRLVIAAGGWSRHLGAMLGVDLPISGAPLQMLVTEPTRPILKQLIAHADRHLTMKQAASGNLIIGGAWPADTDRSTGYAKVLRTSIEGNLWVAERTVPAVAGLHLLRSWAAMNVNIDGAPLLGPIPGANGAFIAATANGYTLGPIMGQLTADLVLERGQHRDLRAFTLSRFG